MKLLGSKEKNDSEPYQRAGAELRNSITAKIINIPQSLNTQCVNEQDKLNGKAYVS